MSIPQWPIGPDKLARQLVAVLALATLLAPQSGCSQAGGSVQLKTASVTRGDVRATISATGTIEPEEVVDVGAQVAGKIKNLGMDPKKSGKTIDYGSVVEHGTVLAQIDDSIYKSQVQQARANLQKAEADMLRSM